MTKELPQGALLGHYACPQCLSNNNLAVYVKTDEAGNEKLDGSCFTPDCKRFWSEAELREGGVFEEGFVTPKVKVNPKEPITKVEYNALTAICSHDTTMLDGSLYRGIKTETAAFYGHLFERNAAGEIIKTYYPETKFDYRGECNSLRGYKTRVLPKVFGMGNIGITGLSNDFSGQHKFPIGGKKVLIVGGEEDKLAAAQMLREYQIGRNQSAYDRYAVVSPTSGEGGLAKSCSANYDWLNTFEEIILCMDNDKAGQKAIAAALKVLPEGKVSLMLTSLNDPSQMLQEGRQKQFISNFYDAKPLVSTGIVSFGEAAKGIKEFLLAPKIEFPPMLHRLNAASRGGIRSTGAIVNIIADTSIGKTLVSDVLQLWWGHHSPLKPTTLTIERTQEEFVVDMLSNHVKKNLTWIEPDKAVDYLDSEEGLQMIHDLSYDDLGQPRFYIIDDRSGSVASLKAQVYRAWKMLGSRLFIFDPLSDVLRQLPNEEQEDFMLWEKQMKKEGLVFINILHTRKPAPNKDGTIRPVTEYDAIGTGSFVQSADINLVLNRNKMAKDDNERNTMVVEAPKLRNGTTGHICDLIYDPVTRQQHDKIDFFAQQPSDF